MLHGELKDLSESIYGILTTNGVALVVSNVIVSRDQDFEGALRRW